MNQVYDIQYMHNGHVDSEHCFIRDLKRAKELAHQGIEFGADEAKIWCRFPHPRLLLLIGSDHQETDMSLVRQEFYEIVSGLLDVQELGKKIIKVNQ